MTVWDRYRAIAESAPDAPAVQDQQGRSLTHGQLLTEADGAAAGLADIGLEPGAVIGVFLPNRVTWLVAALAAAKAGIGLLGLNTRFRHQELEHLLSVARVDTVLVADTFLGTDGPTLMAELDRPPTVIVDRTPGHPDGAAGESAVEWREIVAGEPRMAAAEADQPLIGFTTSGTTGLPKIAMHTQGQTAAHLDAVIPAFGLTERTVHLAPLPLCGTFGFTMAMATLIAGGSVVAHETWDPEAAAVAMDKHGVTFFSAADDMLLAMVGNDRFNPDTSWRSGGFADFTNNAAEALATTDSIGDGQVRLCGLYGSSEGFALMSTWLRTDGYEDRLRAGGHLVSPSMAVQARDPDRGDVLAHGRPGELWFRGPNLIECYLNNKEATAEAFRDGWYRSGDLGYTVEPDQRGHQGFVFLSRLGDSLRLRGFLCDPSEIEHHLESHDAVELAQVVGVKQGESGEVAVAFVKLTAQARALGGETVDEAVLDQHCRSGLANYKRPERIEFVDSFPVTDGPNGVKIRKVDLRVRAAGLLSS